MRTVGALLALLLMGGAAHAQNCPVPNTFINGTIIDANQVNANFAALTNCAINAVHVATNAALAATPSTTFPNGVWRDDFSAGLGAPPLFYVNTGTACSAPDNGAQVPSADGKCWVARFYASGADIREWGCKLDGATDDSTCVTQATSWLKASKGPLVSPPGKTLAHSSTIDISSSNIVWRCGLGNSAGTGEEATTQPCAFKWIGANAGTMMTDTAPTGAAALNLSGQEFGPFTFLGNAGLAANGLDLVSVNQSNFHPLSFDQFSGGIALHLDVIHATGATFGTTPISQFNNFDMVVVNNTGGYTSQPIVLDNWFSASSACGGVACGGNASFNHFNQIKVNWLGSTSTTPGAGGYVPGSAVTFSGADNNVIDQIVCSSTSAAGYCLDFGISNLNGGLAPANSNVVKHASAPTGQATGISVSRGTTSYAGCTMNVTCSFGNIIRDMDRGNNTGFPSREAGTGSGVFWTDTFGMAGPFTRVNTTNGGGIMGASGALPSAGSCTGLGGGTCSVFAGTDSAGAIQLSPLAGAGGAGIVVLTFNVANAQFDPTIGICTTQMANGTGSWGARAQAIVSDAAANVTIAWDNNGSNLANGSTYFINYHCFGL